jgi:hypothetical protein
MAKKQKRSVSASNASESVFVPASAARSTSTVRASYSQEFKPDYTHVIRDLKQIAYLAGGFVIVLVGLSFILR